MAALAGMFGTMVAGSGAAEVKTPGKTYCFRGYCRRVKTIAETRREIGKRRSLIASFYDSCRRDRFNPCGLTSSGERFQPHKPNNAASPIYPDGTLLQVWNPANRRSLVVRINNAGPYNGNRMLDVSRAAADRLGFRHRGVARVYVKVLRAPTPAQARYKRNRRYAPAPGFIGVFASIDRALVAAGRSIGGLFTPANAATPERTRVAKTKTRKRTRSTQNRVARVTRGTGRRIARRNVGRKARSTRVVSRRSKTRMVKLRQTKSGRRIASRRTGSTRSRVARRNGYVTREEWLRAGRGAASGKRARVRGVRSTRLNRERRRGAS